jgi:hypothetical protein
LTGSCDIAQAGLKFAILLSTGITGVHYPASKLFLN